MQLSICLINLCIGALAGYRQVVFIVSTTNMCILSLTCALAGYISNATYSFIPHLKGMSKCVSVFTEVYKNEQTC
jgi:hypothetical protein